MALALKGNSPMHDTFKLLQQIADNTATDNAVWVAAVAGGAE